MPVHGKNPAMHHRTLSILLALLTSVTAFAADEATTLIDEKFDSESIPEKWQAGGRKGSFTMIEGSLRGVAQPDDSHGPSISHSITAHDVAIEFDMKMVNPDGYFLFLLDGDSQFKGQAHLLRLSAFGKKVQLMQDRGDPASKMEQKKQRDANGGKRIPATKEQLADPNFYRIEQLANQTATPANGEWHHIRIELKGNAVTAQFDGQKPFSATGTVLDVPKSKIVFLVGKSADVRIDNVKVQSLSK
jgi:hypothetical protein